MFATVMLLTYNQEPYVAAAVQALLAQNCEPVDILISDDASTDGTAKAIEAALSGYSGPHRVRVNQNPHNLGIARHINRCMEMIGTDIVIAAAGDDISMPDRVARTLDAFRRTDALLVHSRVEQIGPDGEVLSGAYPQDSALFLRSTALRRAAVSMALYIGATGAWHRALYDRYGPIRNPDCYEDLILGFRAALEGRIAFVDPPLVRYRIGLGVSHVDVTKPSSDWKTTRLRTLSRERQVLEHRLADTEPSENPQKNASMALLWRAIRMNKLRRESYEAHTALFFARHLTSLPAAISALLLERASSAGPVPDQRSGTKDSGKAPEKARGRTGLAVGKHRGGRCLSDSTELRKSSATCTTAASSRV